MNVDESGAPVHAEWEAFAKRHAGNPFLEHDPLYALSEPIIDAIKGEVTTFFTEDQERFERDLARTASFGFCHRRALGITARDTQPDPETGLSWQDRHECAARSIDEMLAEELRRDGLSEGEIGEYLQQGAKQRKVIEARKDAYTGWLISNRRFHDEVGALRASWGPLVQGLGRFPVYARWPFFDDLGGADVPGDFREDCARFYRRWGLDRLLTWDWPVPMEPDLTGGLLQDLHLLSHAGVLLFVPWYLLRGERLNLQAVAQRGRTACEAEHLRDWLRKQAGHVGDEMGDARYERMQWIYRYLELGLRRRYGPACRGNVQRLDRALAAVLEREEDTVKKLRLELSRALRGS